MRTRKKKMAEADTTQSYLTEISLGPSRHVISKALECNERDKKYLVSFGAWRKQEC